MLTTSYQLYANNNPLFRINICIFQSIIILWELSIKQQTMLKLALSSVLLCISIIAYNQDNRTAIQNYFNKNQAELGLTANDIQNWTIYDEHQSLNSPINYVYIRQTINNIEIYDAMGNFAVTENVTVLSGDRLIRDIQGHSISSNKEVTAVQAANIALNKYCDAPKGISSSRTIEAGVSYEFESASSLETIPVRLMYQLVNNELRLVWDLHISPLDAEHWWSSRIDAETGDIIDEVDWVRSCDFGEHHDHSKHNGADISAELQMEEQLLAMPPTTDAYRVFEIPIESPNHGSRTLVVAPSDPTASPYGWHDDNGVLGDEYTITRGNNVRAMEDVNGNNGNGYSPDSGGSNVFDYPVNFTQQPINYQDAVITNLFYMNNIMHDVWYHYGFDEPSGNFQQNNYGNGGSGSDYVNADAQDGGGMNNANFSTPTDGNKPRMQMYLWTQSISDLLTINSPAGLAGSYGAVEATFGPGVPASPLTADLALFDDNVPDENDACENAVNGPSLNGKIVVIRRGTCLFVDKVTLAESYGAVAVIMVNNVSGTPIAMGGTGNPGIPSVMVSDVDGEALITALQGGATINGTLQNQGTPPDKDGDFDNMIISHEYGHGISTRLTGGANNSNCLNNSEQMGEGWSDWFGLMLTIEPGDTPTDNRGVGTYVIGEATTGVGIRPAPYNTDFAVNGYTYDATNDAANISEPHGIGFVWCTMLWDMTWAFINQYGFDPDLYNGTGGNNMAMELVITALKLQPCSPGFVDGRDAILQADQLLNGGVNQCLIWNAFANRGLGYSANQGSSNSRSDQTEAFDLPPGMINSTGSETVSTCSSYTWPADGNTYTSSGTYTAVLANQYGCDSTVTLNLTVGAGVTATENITSCTNYTWPADGNTYSSTGTYTAVLTAANGCDSTITLNLTISSTSSSDSYASACDSYIWTLTGNTYSASGIYDTTVTGASGCDSIVTLHLTINNSSFTDEYMSTCGSYTWPLDGNTYSSTGNYTTTTTSSTGCDSTVTLHLTVAPNATGSETVAVCESYTWPTDGNTYTTSGNYTATLTSANGCDSIITLNLTINSANAGITETTPGTLEVTTTNPSAIQWINCAFDFDMTGETGQTFYPTATGFYGAVITANGCTDTSNCIYTIVAASGIGENSLSDMLKVYPNPTFGNLVVDLGKEYSNVKLQLMAVNGQVLETRSFESVSQVQYTIDEAAGMYILKIVADDSTVLIRVMKE